MSRYPFLARVFDVSVISIFFDGFTDRQYCTLEYRALQYRTMQYPAIPYNTFQYSTIPYDTLQYRTVTQLCPTLPYPTQIPNPELSVPRQIHLIEIWKHGHH